MGKQRRLKHDGRLVRAARARSFADVPYSLFPESMQSLCRTVIVEGIVGAVSRLDRAARVMRIDFSGRMPEPSRVATRPAKDYPAPGLYNANELMKRKFPL